MSYGPFAGFYDCFTSDVGYAERCEYILGLFDKFDRIPSLLLDVGCGTGGFSFEMAKHGIDVIGADPSPEMLAVAQNKEFDGKFPLFLNQSASELDLYGTVDGAIACLDTLNHITEYSELAASLKRISLFLEPERLFIFDVNTPYKHKNVLSGKKFVYDNGEKLCIWKNSRCKRDGTVKMKLRLYEITDDGYRKYTDTLCERAYGEAELGSALDGAGLRVLAVFDDMTLNAPRDTSERLYYVTEKVK